MKRLERKLSEPAGATKERKGNHQNAWLTCLTAGAVLGSMTITGCYEKRNEIKAQYKTPQISDVVTLKDHLKKESNDVQITNNPKSWMRENEVGYVPNGTKAKVLAIHDETISAGDTSIRILRYKVVTLKGKRMEGWIWASDTGYNPNPNK